ncbi:MAG TPA: hypothetical protein VG650_02120 [Mycobacteriales bacterium]|nr:hypothetical protein [Mycobacteriales bacterium]
MKRLWLVTLLLAVGCGSTLNESAQTTTATGNGLAPAPVQQAPVTSEPTAARGGASTATTIGTPTGTTTSVAPSRAAASSSATASRPTLAANHDPIKIGFVTTGVGNAQSLGVNAGQSYSDKDMFGALVAAYNAHGGIAGHRIIPVYGATDTASSNWANQFAAVCAQFTQDNHVAAVIGYVFVFLPSFERCLANAHVPHLYGGYQPGDVIDQQQYPTLVSTANPTTDGAMLTVLDGALRTGLLTKTTKLGLLLDTCADGDRAYSRTIEPWLKAHGLNYQTVIGNCAQGATDVSGAVSAVSNAELRFATSGVKLVFGSAVEMLLFMEDAQTQGYQPNYLTGVGGAALEANAPASQLQHLYGFGWLPAVDVDPAHQPAPRRAPQKACLAMLAKHGLQAKQYNDFMAAYAACDGLSLYAKALAAGATTAQEVVAQVSAAQASLAGALTYDGQLRATSAQHGGPGVYREYAWSPACSCLTYRGPTYPVPSP